MTSYKPYTTISTEENDMEYKITPRLSTRLFNENEDNNQHGNQSYLEYALQMQPSFEPIVISRRETEYSKVGSETPLRAAAEAARTAAAIEHDFRKLIVEDKNDKNAYMDVEDYSHYVLDDGEEMKMTKYPSTERPSIFGMTEGPQTFSNRMRATSSM